MHRAQITFDALNTETGEVQCAGTKLASYRGDIDALGYVAGGVCVLCIAIIFAMSNRMGRVAIAGALLLVAVAAALFTLYVTGRSAHLTS